MRSSWTLQVRKTDAAHAFVSQRNAWKKAIKNHGLERSLKMAVPDEVYQNLKKEFGSIEKQ